VTTRKQHLRTKTSYAISTVRFGKLKRSHYGNFPPLTVPVVTRNYAYFDLEYIFLKNVFGSKYSFRKKEAIFFFLRLARMKITKYFIYFSYNLRSCAEEKQQK
jgi:hypothetical protein